MKSWRCTRPPSSNSVPAVWHRMNGDMGCHAMRRWSCSRAGLLRLAFRHVPGLEDERRFASLGHACKPPYSACRAAISDSSTGDRKGVSIPLSHIIEASCQLCSSSKLCQTSRSIKNSWLLKVPIFPATAAANRASAACCDRRRPGCRSRHAGTAIALAT